MFKYAAGLPYYIWKVISNILDGDSSPVIWWLVIKSIISFKDL